MFLKVKSISQSYSKKRILNDINFTQQEGEIISLIGSSGAGKSTLLKSLAGLCKIQNGSISLNSSFIQNIEPNNRNISYVFQDSPLFPHLNVLENIVFNLKDYDNDRLDLLLSKALIKKLINKYPYEISGGENQRVAVVRSIIRKPDLLLLDEPFSNLDNATKKFVKDIVFEIIKFSNITTIIVSHDFQESLGISDKIMILEDGRIDSFDIPEIIYNKPKNLKTARLFGDVVNCKFENENIYIRPENVCVVSSSKNIVSVIKSEFLGEKYRVTANFGSNIIFFYYQSNLSKGSNVFIELRIDKKLVFKSS